MSSSLTPTVTQIPSDARPLDVLVLGSGVAGLSSAVRLAASGAGALRVGVLTKAELWQSATRWAQGGVAAVLGGDEDSTDLHLADTLAAGAGLCDTEAVRVLVDEGPGRVNELIALGAEFDRQPGGALALAREGGHSMARVVHAGGAATGAEVERALVEATRASATVVLEQWFALDLLVEGGRCRGVRALSPDGQIAEVRANHTVLATGGAGQLFAVTTNPPEATADGLAMALRARVPVADMEFMQFHPTALHHPAMPRPLLSEALRGHGALLRDAEGERFVDELAPRDLVSRAMAERMRDRGREHLWLDATGLEAFGSRFPTITASLAAIGLDPSRDWLPIAPAAHYLSGGVVTDLSGATALPGLWAAGEVACTGVHGANRLASNSLLEGMVFGARLAESILDGGDGPSPTGVMRAVMDEGWAGAINGAGSPSEPPSPAAPPGTFGSPAIADPPTAADGRLADERIDVQKERDRLQRTMIDGAGVVRSAGSLAGAALAIAEVGVMLQSAGNPRGQRDHGELANLVVAARALLGAATLRRETRGAHARSDFPATDDRWRRRIVHSGDRVAVLTGSAAAGPGPS
ncbi:MAG TPA: FAD-binding protein [Acidimicrobiales bacterium]|nr:FAD-binding protein [Acidimicrobiales bacterium]